MHACVEDKMQSSEKISEKMRGLEEDYIHTMQCI